jgi:DNA-binding SARP family transcriptional activator
MTNDRLTRVDTAADFSRRLGDLRAVGGQVPMRDIFALAKEFSGMDPTEIEALLELGRHGGLVAELEALVAAHPGRERLCAQLMLALYRSGRQAEALDVFRDGRRRAAELGLDPGPDLVRLERAILNHDPSLESPVVAGGERPSGSQRRRASSHAEAPVPPDSLGGAGGT